MIKIKTARRKLTVFIAKLSSLDAGNERLDLCGVSRIVVRIFLHQRRCRFYAAHRSEARASRNILPFSSLAAASTHLTRVFGAPARQWVPAHRKLTKQCAQQALFFPAEFIDKYDRL
jgi:hypothetical protein